MTYHFTDTSLPKIIVIGGGFAGLQLIKKLNNKPYRVILLDKHNYHTFQPLLYQIASAGLTAESIAYPFRRKVGEYPNIIFRLAEVTKIDTVNKSVVTTVGNFDYDYLVIANGATTNFYGNTTMEKLSLTLKSIPEALDMRSAILEKMERAIVSETQEKQKQSLNFIIVGGGPTGVELAGAIAEIRENVIPHDYRELKKENMEVQLIEGSNRLLAGMTEKSSALAKKYLEKKGVKVWLDVRVKNFDGTQLTLSNGQSIITDNVIWAAGVKGIIIPGIESNAVVNGRYLVDAFNKLKDHQQIYALGDIALMLDDEKFPKGHPGVAQVAIQQASLLAKNFMNMHRKQALKSFHYKDKGSMATIGRHKAVVDLPNITFGGYLAWYAWMFIHLMALVGFRNRFMVFMNWMWNYFSYDRVLRIIVPVKQNRPSEN